MNQFAYIVDDDEAIRDSLSWLMESRGISCKTFPSAESFLEAWNATFAAAPICLPRAAEYLEHDRVELAGFGTDGGTSFSHCTLKSDCTLHTKVDPPKSREREEKGKKALDTLRPNLTVILPRHFNS